MDLIAFQTPSSKKISENWHQKIALCALVPELYIQYQTTETGRTTSNKGSAKFCQFANSRFGKPVSDPASKAFQ